jgi:hypothetical protein
MKNVIALFGLCIMLSNFAQAQIVISPGQSIWFGNQQVTCFNGNNQSTLTKACSCIESGNFRYDLVLTVFNQFGESNRVVLRSFNSSFPNTCQAALSQHPQCQ